MTTRQNAMTNTRGQMTPAQLHIVRHSLGLTDKGTGREYRNYYVCDPEPALEELCDLGVMKDYGSREMFGGMHFYRVTEAGKAAERAQRDPEPKLSPSKRRYQDYLNADSGMSFGEWIKMKAIVVAEKNL